jgi:hypothetical protein
VSECGKPTSAWIMGPIGKHEKVHPRSQFVPIHFCHHLKGNNQRYSRGANRIALDWLVAMRPYPWWLAHVHRPHAYPR